MADGVGAGVAADAALLPPVSCFEHAESIIAVSDHRRPMGASVRQVDAISSDRV